jgi:AcrR family transcriptional regulator
MPPRVASTESDSRGRTLRRDAADNRERILLVASAAFRREGSKVPLTRVADEAGVGAGTLYRHFPSREALFEALTEQSYRSLLEVAHDVSLLEVPAHEAIAVWLRRILVLREELVLPLHGGPLVFAPQAVELRREIQAALDSILARGVAEDTIRPDVTGVDVILFGAMLAHPLNNVPDWDSAVQRQVELFLTSLEATDARKLETPAPESIDSIYPAKKSRRRRR